MSTRYTKEELEEYFFEALAMFNDVLESDITSENVVLDFLILSIMVYTFNSYKEDSYAAIGKAA